MVLHYKNGIGVFEGSWDLPRSFQDLEVFGLKGTRIHDPARSRNEAGRESKTLPWRAPAGALRAHAYMVSALRNKKPIEAWWRSTSTSA